MVIKPWNAITAMGENRIIGNDFRLPWSIPKDMTWYKSMTKNQILVVGRKTFESIKTIILENKYVVLTHQTNYKTDYSNVQIINHITDIPESDSRQVWICGGAELYIATLKQCKYLYLTIIKQKFEGDTFFPPFEDSFILDETIYNDDIMIIKKYKNKYMH